MHGQQGPGAVTMVTRVVTMVTGVVTIDSLDTGGRSPDSREGRPEGLEVEVVGGSLSPSSL